jgi:hypothetical protein
MTSTKFKILAVIAILGACAIFGIPESVWWDTGSLTPRVLFGAGIGGWIYVIAQVIKSKFKSK